MKYEILDNNKNVVKVIESTLSEDEILRNYPLGYSLKIKEGI